MSYPKKHLWKQAPFLRLIIPLMSGIISAWYFPPDLSFLPVILAGSFILAALALWIIVERSAASFSKYLNLLLFVFVFFLGILFTTRHDAAHRAGFAGRQLNDSSDVVLRLREPPVEKPASWKAEADIMQVGNDNGFQHTSGRAILYFQKTDSLLPLHYGDVVITKNRLQPVHNSGNPGAFDYNRYCHLHNIFYQAYLPADAWHKLSFTRANPLTTFFLACRSWCLKTLATYIHDERALGVAEALLAGYRDNLDKELVQAYAHAGVVHIIAISGLHLGLIYLILLWILKPLPDKGRSRRLKGTLIILSLWCFTMITGAAPSALRATVMFSFITIARFFVRREADIYNTLAASAFLLLCYDPFLLFDAGFQLSYLAVLGIVIFQKPVFSLFISKNKVWNYCWKMMSVSLAAELLTFPVAVFYFHRFPVLFLAANLVIIPLSSFVLYGEIILLAVAAIKPLATFAGFIVMRSITLMNGIIEGINAISFSSWSGISLNITELFLLYAFMAAMALWLLYKNKRAVIAALSFLLCFSLSEMLADMHTSRQRKIIVFNTPHHKAMDFVEGGSAYFIGDTGVVNNRSLLQYDILPARTYLQTTIKDTLPHLLYADGFIRFFNVTMALVDSTGIQPATALSFPARYVLISHNPSPDFRQIKHTFSPQLVIFDASNAWWKIEKWKTACNQLNLRCFSVPDEGAWELSLK